MGGKIFTKGKTMNDFKVLSQMDTKSEERGHSESPRTPFLDRLGIGLSWIRIMGTLH